MRLVPSHEIVKLGVGGPGSRGGKVVGYRKSGKPIYESERKKPEMVEAKKPPVLSRVSLGLMGGGAAVSQAPLVGRYAKGRATLYHGTTPLRAAGKARSAAEGVIRTGVDPAFAGSMGRLNQTLMANSMGRMLESKGVPVTDAQLSRMEDLFKKRMKAGEKAGEASKSVYKAVTDHLVRHGKMTREKADDIGKNLAKDLAAHGHRTYWGSHPSYVLQWGTKLKEKEMAEEAIEKMVGKATKRGPLLHQVATTGKMLLDVFTGGFRVLAQDWLKAAKYKPTDVRSVTRAEAEKIVDRFAEQATKSRGHGSAKARSRRFQVVFGAELPTGQMGYLEDFPGARHAMSASPGLRPALKDYGVQTYDPGRDISFPHGAKAKHLKTVDLVDAKTGKITRLKISDFVRPKRGKILRRLRGAALPAGIAALGAYGIYRALKPKKRLVPRGHRLAKPEEKEQGKEKAAGRPERDVARIAGKYVLPAAAGAAGLGLAGSKLMDKLIPEKPASTPAQEVKEEAKRRTRATAASYVPMFAGIPLGAAAGMALGPKAAPAPARAMVGSLGGMMAGSIIGSSAAQGREMGGKTPEADPYWVGLPPKARDFLAKRPWITGARDAAIAASLPLAGLYAFRKYYPGTYMKSKDWAVRKMQEMV